MSKTQPRLAQDILKEPYARVLIPEDDGTYSAEILEFPGCYAEGDEPDEAIDNLEQAAISWIEAALEQDQEIPPPIATYGYSGKINLRLPRSIHKQAARFAQKDDVSLNQFFTSAIAARIGAEEFYEYLAQRLEHRLASTAYNFRIQNFYFLSQTQTSFVSTANPSSLAPPVTVALDHPTDKVASNV